jgi:hypothetical protein
MCAARVQSLVLGLGKAKQADIETASASFLRFSKIDKDITSTGFTTETDAPEIGKGSEFASQHGVFPVAYTPSGRLEKYAGAEFMTWALAYALGGVSEATGTYTITPIDPGTTLELPYFTIVEQIPEGGDAAIDNAFIGCSLEELNYSFSYGAGRGTSKLACQWAGSGKLTTPSGVSVPALTTDHYMLGSSMALTINGTDYVAAKTILSGSFGWKNNLLLNQGFFPGSGLQNGAAIRGRQEIGDRAATFQYTARLLATSDEYSKLIAQTTGTASMTITFDATHFVTLDFPCVSYKTVTNTEADGIVAVTVNVEIKDNGTDPVVTATTKCGVTGIAQ